MNMQAFLITIGLYSLICGLLAMNIADHKDQSTGAWFACGFFFGILGLIGAAGLPVKSPTHNLTEKEFIQIIETEPGLCVVRLPFGTSTNWNIYEVIYKEFHFRTTASSKLKLPAECIVLNAGVNRRGTL